MANVTITKNTYTIDSLYQWDVNQVLTIYGLSLASAPEIHFANEAMSKAIVRQATMDSAGVIRADIPNGLLQKTGKINAYVCVTEGKTFRSLYKIVIPVTSRAQPSGYEFVEEDGLSYSVNALTVEVITLGEDEEATVDKNFNDGNTILTFGIPRGKKGDKGDKGDSGVSSWNDLPDKPFGEIVRPLYVLEETECTTDAESMVEGVFAGEIAVGECPFGPGDFYTVNFDGVDYTCMADGDLTNTWIGNLALVGDESDTGEPFCLLALNAGGSISLSTKTKGIHSLSVAVADSTVSEVKQLDEKYIPDTIARVADIPKSTDSVNYDLNVKAVNHRGFSTEAPENTIPAYILSKKKGFTYVECDVSFTKDGVAVLLHDGTINRTSDGSGNIADLNYADVFQYDFGSWKSSEYAGTKIPTFKEFITLCRNLGLHPYIELKSSGSYTKEQICSLVDIVEEYGMKGKVTWISFSATFLAYVRDYDKTARLGYVCSLTSAAVSVARNLRTGENDVFLDCSYSSVTDVTECVAADIPLEVWTVNSANAIKNLHPYVSGVTSDSLIAGKILHDASMTYAAPNEPDLSVIGVSLDTTELSFTSKEYQVVNATVLPVGCTDPVEWTSSDENVVTVSRGMMDTECMVTPVRSGSAIVKVTVGSVSAECAVTVDVDDRTLLYNWDFTNSMTDTVSGLTPTLQNNAAQDANGLSITQANAYANFGAIAKRGMTFELDITADSNLNTGTAHGRLLCFSKSNSALDDGVLWRGGNYNYWGTYLSSGWGKGQLSTDPNVFSGKTMTTVINEDGTVDVYADTELLVKTNDVVDFESGGYVTVGSSSIAAIGVTITGMRIYDGTITIPQTKPDDWVDDAIVLTADDFIAKGIAFSSETGADYPYLMSRTDRISFVGYNVTLDPGYEYTLTCESTTGAIGKVAVRQVPSWYDIKAKVHISESHDSGWKDNGYKFTQRNSYECAWITLAAENTTDAISLDDLTSITITRNKA